MRVQKPKNNMKLEHCNHWATFNIESLMTLVSWTNAVLYLYSTLILCYLEPIEECKYTNLRHKRNQSKSEPKITCNTDMTSMPAYAHEIAKPMRPIANLVDKSNNI